MSTKRELITDLRAHRAGLVEKKEEIEAELAGIEGALEALNGRVHVDKIKTPRAAPGARMEQVLDTLRAHPDARYDGPAMADATGMAPSTATTVMRRMVVKGEVDLVGESARGGPLVKHKPTTIKPGEGVSE